MDGCTSFCVPRLLATGAAQGSAAALGELDDGGVAERFADGLAERGVERDHVGAVTHG